MAVMRSNKLKVTKVLVATTGLFLLAAGLIEEFSPHTKSHDYFGPDAMVRIVGGASLLLIVVVKSFMD